MEIKGRYLYITIRFLGHKGHIDREEIVGVAVYRELHTARLVACINDREAPLQEAVPLVVRVVPVTLSHHWRSSTRPREREMFLFNDTLNTFYVRLYGVRHMVKDHSDSEKENLLPPHRLLLSINSKGSFICTIPDRITHITAFVTPVVEHWLEREIAQWVHCTMSERSTSELHPAPHLNTVI